LTVPVFRYIPDRQYSAAYTSVGLRLDTFTPHSSDTSVADDVHIILLLLLLLGNGGARCWHMGKKRKRYYFNSVQHNRYDVGDSRVLR